jgi:hypothetical protein
MKSASETRFDALVVAILAIVGMELIIIRPQLHPLPNRQRGLCRRRLSPYEKQAHLSRCSGGHPRSL